MARTQQEIAKTQQQQADALQALLEQNRTVTQSNVVQAVATAALTTVVANSREMTAMVYKQVLGQGKQSPEVDSGLFLRLTFSKCLSFYTTFVVF